MVASQWVSIAENGRGSLIYPTARASTLKVKRGKYSSATSETASNKVGTSCNGRPMVGSTLE
jgi:hypothetical protein